MRTQPITLCTLLIAVPASLAASWAGYALADFVDCSTNCKEINCMKMDPADPNFDPDVPCFGFLPGYCASDFNSVQPPGGDCGNAFDQFAFYECPSCANRCLIPPHSEAGGCQFPSPGMPNTCTYIMHAGRFKCYPRTGV